MKDLVATTDKALVDWFENHRDEIQQVLVANALPQILAQPETIKALRRRKCKTCGGTGKIMLFTSEATCDCSR